MITPSRPVRALSAASAAAGAVLLAGCAPASSSEGEGAGTPGTYVDGTYTAEGSYQTPQSVERIEVTIALADGIVTGVEVQGEPTTPQSEEYQGEFVDGIADAVIGRPLDELDISRVAGSSLTSGGFNEALAQIRDDAGL